MPSVTENQPMPGENIFLPRVQEKRVSINKTVKYNPKKHRILKKGDRVFFKQRNEAHNLRCNLYKNGKKASFRSVDGGFVVICYGNIESKEE